MKQECQKCRREDIKAGYRTAISGTGRINGPVLILLFFLIVFFLPPLKTYGAVSLTQTDAGTNYAVVASSGSSGTLRFFISSSPNGMFSHLSSRIRSEGGNRWKITGLSAGSTYYVKVRSGSALSAPCEIVTGPSGAVTSIRQVSAGKSSAEIVWNSVSGATGYEVQVLTGTGQVMQTRMTGNPKITITGLPAASSRVIIRPARKGKTYTAKGNPSELTPGIRPLPGKISGITFEKQKLKKHKAEFSWTGNGAEGYEIELFDHRGQTILCSKSASPFVHLKSRKLKMNRFYGIRVRGYILLSGQKKYGAWSGIRPFSGGSSRVRLSQRDGNLSVSWSRVTGATSYSVYVSVKAPRSLKKMKKVKTTKNTKLSLRAFRGSRIRNERIYYVAVIANRKYGRKTYRSKTTAYYYLE